MLRPPPTSTLTDTLCPYTTLFRSQGYQGFVQFAIVAQRATGQSGDSILEVDSNGNEDSLPRTFVRLANFTFLHRSTLASSINAMLFRGGADYTAVKIGRASCRERVCQYV